MNPNNFASIDIKGHFPMQRIQTDRGSEFLDAGVQKRLMALHIKFRPTKPRSPHLNGKVERTQHTDWEEFYSLVDLKALDLPEQLQQWQTYYNRERRHSSIGTSPWQKLQDRLSLIPTQQEVSAIYQASTEAFAMPTIGEILASLNGFGLCKPCLRFTHMYSSGLVENVA